jgi:hypothetical protein
MLRTPRGGSEPRWPRCFGCRQDSEGRKGSQPLGIRKRPVEGPDAVVAEQVGARKLEQPGLRPVDTDYSCVRAIGLDYVSTRGTHVGT